ncbi:hypothetical protein ATSB10_24530 [Dyella thiooxydans]|uniref:Uncharacterized protein n=1 Tax=Dyella thiooxydans TaxID=445710 RepID=A0A160N2R7_9GAMM|nr:hypothetical protein ATSB10_24530 [Dyella thiooxydans]
MRRWWLVLAVALLLAGPALAGEPVVASGQADGATAAWTLMARTPDGWTADCCTYARAIGVDAVVYRGEWSGEPQRVMVLNAWPAKLPSLDAELAADRSGYLHRDPTGRALSLPIAHPSMHCAANVYEGSDRVDDMVVFCDPGKASGIRFSWSMTLAADDGQRRALLDELLAVVRSTVYRRGATQPTAARH